MEEKLAKNEISELKSLEHIFKIKIRDYKF